MVKYLAELYNYRMIGSSIIFKTLYSLIFFGVIYDGNLSFIAKKNKAKNKKNESRTYTFGLEINESYFVVVVVNQVNEAIAANEFSLDPIDNFLRIRLVCVILDTCGQYFDRGSTKKKLDCFILYFQVNPTYLPSSILKDL